jgi:hypothetical protein
MRIIASEDGNEKRTTIFAHPIVQVRSNVYFTISRCIKVRLYIVIMINIGWNIIRLLALVVFIVL